MRPDTKVVLLGLILVMGGTLALKTCAQEKPGQTIGWTEGKGTGELEGRQAAPVPSFDSGTDVVSTHGYGIKAGPAFAHTGATIAIVCTSLPLSTGWAWLRLNHMRADAKCVRCGRKMTKALGGEYSGEIMLRAAADEPPFFDGCLWCLQATLAAVGSR